MLVTLDASWDTGDWAWDSVSDSVGVGWSWTIWSFQQGWCCWPRELYLQVTVIFLDYLKILTRAPRDKNNYFLYFTDEETGTRMLKEMCFEMCRLEGAELKPVHRSSNSRSKGPNMAVLQLRLRPQRCCRTRHPPKAGIFGSCLALTNHLFRLIS